MEGFNQTIILVLLLILFSSMDFKHKIIQWNCRGLKPNYDEVTLLISEYNPSVFCFQETFLKPDDNISLRGFNIYNYVHTDWLRPSGGASIFVKSSGKLHGITALVINFLTSNQLLVNINQLFETLEEKK